MKLEVRVEKVAFRKDNGWAILVTDKGTCKGVVSWEPVPEDLLILEGEWSKYQGRDEFKFSTAQTTVPSDPMAQLNYVCLKTLGMGAKTQGKIAEIYGDNWRDIEMGKVPGLSQRVFDNFKEAIAGLSRDQDKVNTISWLMSMGASLALADGAWNLWEVKAHAIVTSNCYRLSDVKNFGFASVDKGIRQNFGIADNDPRRIRAAIEYTMKQMTEQGSTAVHWEEFRKKAEEITGGLHGELITELVRDMIKDGTLRAFPETKMICLGVDYAKAEIIWEYVK